MKKKIFTFLFAILIMPCVFMLTACDGGKDPEHTHDYKTTWSTSTTHHWHDCKGDGCTEKSDYAEHSYSNYVCECGYEDPNKPTEPTEPSEPSGPSDPGVVDPSGPHTCDFKTTWSKDATHHWHDCTGDDCTEKSDYAEHSYTNYECVCGYEDPNKPTDPSNPGQEVENEYAEVISKIEEQMATVMEVDIDVEMIDIDEDGKLVWWGYDGTNFVKYKLGTELQGTTNEAIIQTLNESTRKTRYGLVDTYASDKTLATDATLINDLTETLVGDGYTVLVGGLSNPVAGSVDPVVGNYSGFAIDLLLEKDGIIYEYNDTIIARRDWDDKTAYEAVTQGTENVTYKTQSEVKTLGNLAKDYQAEVEKNKNV